MNLNNKYYLLRHGEAISNAKNIISSWPEKFRNYLTGKGKEQINISAKISQLLPGHLTVGLQVLPARQS